MMDEVTYTIYLASCLGLGLLLCILAILVLAARVNAHQKRLEIEQDKVASLQMRIDLAAQRDTFIELKIGDTVKVSGRLYQFAALTQSADGESGEGTLKQLPLFEENYLRVMHAYRGYRPGQGWEDGC